jgi:signal transduction histidine kinase
VIRLGLRYKFIFTLLGFTLIVAVPLGALAIMRFSDELKSQLRVKWETTVKIWSEQLSRESERGLLLGESCSWWGRQWSSEVFYMRVTWESESTQIPNPERRIERIECEYKNPKLTPLIVKHFNQLSAPIEPGQLYSSFGPGFLDIIYATPLRLRPAPTLNLVEGQALIRLGIDLAPIQAHVRRQATLIILVVIGYVVLGILIAFMFYKMILGPAESLTKALQRFKLDPSARAHIATGDELEMLAHEFNAMADALSERNRRLEQMNADLVKANRAKSDFLAMMSHELKTPLHAIRGYSQLLLEGVDGPLTPAQREDLENILNAGDHLLELIDNILRFSKLEASEDRPYFEAVESINDRRGGRQGRERPRPQQRAGIELSRRAVHAHRRRDEDQTSPHQSPQQRHQVHAHRARDALRDSEGERIYLLGGGHWDRHPRARALAHL